MVGKPGDPGPASDLVVTSDSTPERGQVAIFEGILRTDVDIGIGYHYPILLENAVLIAELQNEKLKELKINLSSLARKHEQEGLSLPVIKMGLRFN